MRRDGKVDVDVSTYAATYDVKRTHGIIYTLPGEPSELTVDRFESETVGVDVQINKVA